MKSVRVERWLTIICLLKPEFTLFFFSYLCVTWVPRKLDMVSSKFCRRSAMFLTVRNRLVSGSSPGGDMDGRLSSKTFGHTNNNLHRGKNQTHLKGPRWRAGWSLWRKRLHQFLLSRSQGSLSPRRLFGIWGKGKKKLIVQGSARGWILSILNYCAFSGNLIFGKLSRKRDKPD